MEIFGVGIYEWIGYLASTTVLVSLLMSSIIKLRWINLAGSFIFALYGILIGAFPVVILNVATIGINVFYLYKIYAYTEYFKSIPVDINSSYFKYFLQYYSNDLDKIYFPDPKNSKDIFGFFVLRNMATSGVFLLTKKDDESAMIELDYVIPEYRDFKVGKYIFEQKASYFINQGIKKVFATSYNEKHEKYLKKMGFKKAQKPSKLYFKEIK